MGLALGCLLAGAVRAQEVPRSVDPGQIEKRFQAPTRPREEVAPLIPGVSRELTPERARSIRFSVLSAIVIDGATAYPENAFAPFYQDLLAREVSLADIYAVAARITKKYAADGYLLSKAVVPAQKVELGIIHIHVIEGYLKDIIFEGKVKGSTSLLETYASKITESQPLKADVLERYILLMNDLPGLSAKRRLVPVPGEEGAYNLIVTLNHDTAYGFARIDNRGSRYEGPVQMWAGGGVNSLFGGWDNTQVRAVTVPNTRELQFADISHSEIIGDEGTRLTLGASTSRSRPGHTLAADRIDSHGLFASAGIEHPLIRSRAEDLFLGGAFNIFQSNRDEADIKTIDDRIRVLRLWVRGGLTDGLDGRNTAAVYVSKGLGIFDATPQDDALSSRTGAPNDFTKVVFDLSRYQPLSPRWGLLAAVGGQRSGTKLFLSEQYGIGGEQFGRAYDPSEIAGDDAIAGKVELQWTSPQGEDFIRQHQYFAYYDHGATWLRSSTDDFELASAGVGARLLIRGGFFASLEVAKPLTRSVEALGDHGNDPRLFFVLSSNF